MRAIIVEFTGADDRDTVEGRARDATADEVPVARGAGQLAPRTERPVTTGSDEGEPA